MGIEPVFDLDDPRLTDYRQVREPELLRGRGVFIAESRAVVRILLGQPRFSVRSLLVTETAWQGLGPAAARVDPSVPVLMASRPLIERVVGYNVHRGCLAAGDRGEPANAASLWGGQSGPAVIVALDNVSNPDNVGGIFRNALAFAALGVLLGPGSADPLYRKSIRVSMGATLRVPFATTDSLERVFGELRRDQWLIAALTPEAGADLATACATLSANRAAKAQRVLLVLGNEGAGLSPLVRGAVDLPLRIPMAAGIDSINVTSAAAVGLALFAQALGLVPGPRAP